MALRCEHALLLNKLTVLTQKWVLNNLPRVPWYWPKCPQIGRFGRPDFWHVLLNNSEPAKRTINAIKRMKFLLSYKLKPLKIENDIDFHKIYMIYYNNYYQSIWKCYLFWFSIHPSIQIISSIRDCFKKEKKKRAMEFSIKGAGWVGPDP